MNSSDNEWEQVYRTYSLSELGWELGKPRPILIEFIEKGLIHKGKALIFVVVQGPIRFISLKKGST